MPFMVENKVKDMSEIVGQEHIKRALEVAAVAGANVLLVGPPGSGKSMFCDVYATLLGDGEMKGVIGVSISHTVKALKQLWIDCDGQERLIIADELPELKRDVLYYIKELSRDYSIPVIANMHPCPCGYYGDIRHQCACTPGQIHKYRTNLSGSILEMFDIHIEAPALPARETVYLTGQKQYGSETTEKILSRIIPARELYNINHAKLALDEDSSRLLEMACSKLGMSGKAITKILQTARCIADLDGEDSIKTHHLSEAIQYRTMGRG